MRPRTSEHTNQHSFYAEISKPNVGIFKMPQLHWPFSLRYQLYGQQGKRYRTLNWTSHMGVVVGSSLSCPTSSNKPSERYHNHKLCSLTGRPTVTMQKWAPGPYLPLIGNCGFALFAGWQPHLPWRTACCKDCHSKSINGSLGTAIRQ